jgi:hypothetical protein
MDIQVTEPSMPVVSLHLVRIDFSIAYCIWYVHFAGPSSRNDNDETDCRHIIYLRVWMVFLGILQGVKYTIPRVKFFIRWYIGPMESEVGSVTTAKTLKSNGEVLRTNTFRRVRIEQFKLKKVLKYIPISLWLCPGDWVIPWTWRT